MSQYLRTNPVARYENRFGVMKVFNAPVRVTAATAIVAGQTGKRIRVMGWISQCASTVVGSYRFRDGAAGSYLTNYISPPLQTQTPLLIPVTDSGYFETSTGNALYLENAIADIDMNVFYVIYTPEEGA